MTERLRIPEDLITGFLQDLTKESGRRIVAGEEDAKQVDRIPEFPRTPQTREDKLLELL